MFAALLIHRTNIFTMRKNTQQKCEAIGFTKTENRVFCFVLVFFRFLLFVFPVEVSYVGTLRGTLHDDVTRLNFMLTL